MKKTFGLIGKNLTHSLSKKYFEEKFKKQKLTNYRYINIEINDISLLKGILSKETISGFNVTSPYKEDIMKELDYIDKEASEIGAVNCVKIINGDMHGFNTDATAFERSIMTNLNGRKKALILGSGGSSHSVQFAFKKLNIPFTIVSRKLPLTYKSLTKNILNKYDIIINCTPLGCFPKIDTYPIIPYQYINQKHLLFDLVYNPKKSKFLSFGENNGSKIKNGEEMLIIQAEESWKIWNSNKNMIQ